MSGTDVTVVMRQMENSGAVQKEAGVNVTERVVVMKKPVERAGVAGVVREATTGRVARMWAVGEPVCAAEVRPLMMVSPARDVRVRPRPELAFYRKYTEAMLRRYVRMSMATGRVPSLLGREMFRARVTSYKVQSFEDVVIFCFDVERCLGKLQREEQDLIKRIALQDYTRGEAAGLLGLSLRDTVRKYAAAIDRLTGIFLAARMLEPLARMEGE